MVKVGGNEIHVKYVKTRQFYEIRWEFCKSRGEQKFPKIGGKGIETGEIGGNSKFVVND